MSKMLTKSYSCCYCFYATHWIAILQLLGKCSICDLRKQTVLISCVIVYGKNTEQHELSCKGKTLFKAVKMQLIFEKKKKKLHNDRDSLFL